MKRATIVAAMSIAAPFAAVAQSPPISLAGFEVASIRIRQLQPGAIAGYKASGPRVEYEAWGIRSLVLEAYDLKPYEIVFARPPVGEPDDYDIVAKAAGDAPRTHAEFRRMLQSLLADRFRLKVHWQGREMPVYALRAGKGGPKLPVTPADVEPRYLGGVNGSNQTIDARAMTMPQLAVEIHSRFDVDRPVVDKTGLAGSYDIKLEATPQGRLLRDPDAAGVGIFTAIQQQLGLKLEPEKARIQVLVIDHIEKPSAN